MSMKPVARGNGRRAVAYAPVVEFASMWENLGHSIPGNPTDLWDWLMGKSTDELLNLLAAAAAKGVNVVEKKFTDRGKAFEHGKVLSNSLALDMADWFTPTAENYFKRISKDQIAAAIKEAIGDEEAAKAAKMKKGKEKSSPKAQPEPARAMHIETVTAACPALAQWLGAAPTSWPALIDKYPLLCALVRISPDARDLAARILGQQGAAMAAALIIERREAGEIKSAGGFMRALIERANTGELHLEKSIYARAQNRLEIA